MFLIGTKIATPASQHKKCFLTQQLLVPSKDAKQTDLMTYDPCCTRTGRGERVAVWVNVVGLYTLSSTILRLMLFRAFQSRVAFFLPLLRQVIVKERRVLPFEGVRGVVWDSMSRGGRFRHCGPVVETLLCRCLWHLTCFPLHTIHEDIHEGLELDVWFDPHDLSFG